MKSGLPRVAAAFVATLVVVVVAAWGCASQNNVLVREHDWQRHEPDGGWVNYVPAQHPDDVDPESAATDPTIQGMPTTTPINPSLTTFH